MVKRKGLFRNIAKILWFIKIKHLIHFLKELFIPHTLVGLCSPSPRLPGCQACLFFILKLKLMTFNKSNASDLRLHAPCSLWKKRQIG